ncbi:hypothetical protein G5C60_38610 [Streptomyces sp. HC44]|uniref:Uncharacterized protein n=1 Tax=Streptomyces scabichelini TaxID=2711217 RepID=A0A6G4VGZ0_9ACTN|nr:hypothetical protein [Streptomyces scabichelini]NGO13356.1 hypothetical protein [Streptomyces scabichelini]
MSDRTSGAAVLVEDDGPVRVLTLHPPGCHDAPDLTAPSSIAETKRTLASWSAELDAVLAEEVRAQPRLLAGADFAEGSAAFLAGRAPRFTGPTTTE